MKLKYTVIIAIVIVGLTSITFAISRIHTAVVDKSYNDSTHVAVDQNPKQLFSLNCHRYSGCPVNSDTACPQLKNLRRDGVVYV